MSDIRLTGAVFIHKESKGFQLEVKIDDTITRLVAQGDVPEKCLYDVRHSLLKNLRVLTIDGHPSEYHIECKCGNHWTMQDTNKNLSNISPSSPSY